MNSSGAMTQELVFYTKTWLHEIDSTFVSALVEQKNVGFPVVRGHGKRHVIKYCLDRVNGVYRTTFNSNICLERFQKLVKRYQVFTYIINHPGVEYNPENHSIMASQAIWDAITSVEPLAYAYMNKGEGEYGNLKYVFGDSPPVTVPVGNMVEVIEISSNNESMNVDNAIGVDMDQCNNTFDKELVWYASASTGSNNVVQTSSDLSRRGTKKKVGETSASSRTRKIDAQMSPTSGPSSVASSSPYKQY